MANPLGYARGKHQLGVFLFSLVNLDPTVRTTPGYIQIAGIVLESDVKKFGPLVTFAGIDPTTMKPDPALWATPGAQMRTLDAGVPMTLLGSDPTPVHGWMLIFIGDMLALHKLNPFVETPSAYCPCRRCDWDTRLPEAYAPYHYLTPDTPRRWKLYTTEFVEAQIAHIRTLSKKDAAPRMQDMGLNTLEHALSPQYLPHFRYVEGCPQEEMHNEDDGLLRAENYQCLNVLFRKWKKFGKLTLDAFNARMADWNWQSTPVPPLHTSVLEGAKGGVPSPGAHLRNTASQTVEFSRALEHLLAPFIPPGPPEPALECWLLHAKYFEMKMARSFTEETIVELERATVAHQARAPPPPPQRPRQPSFAVHPNLHPLPPPPHQEKFNTIGEYKGLFVYKHHCALHAAQDIRWCGPARNRVARMYENKLQYVKRKARMCNFKNPIYSVCPHPTPHGTTRHALAIAIATTAATAADADADAAAAAQHSFFSSFVAASRSQILRSWSLQTARDLARLSDTVKHDLQLEFAAVGCAVSEDFLLVMEDDPAYPVLRVLLEGGGSELFWFEEVISVKVHHVAVAVGCFVSHWGEGYEQPCLSLVTRIVKLQSEEEECDESLWVIVTRFPGVPIMGAGQFRVSSDVWQSCVSDARAHITVFTLFEDFRFSLLHQHTVVDAYVFIPL